MDPSKFHYVKFDPSHFRLKMKKNYKFKGWGYNELGECFNIKFTEHDEDYSGAEYYKGEISAEKIKRLWWWAIDMHGNADTPDERKVWIKVREDNEKMIAKAIRSYIKAMLKFKKYDDMAHVWEGMLKISWDCNLIKVAIANLELMWN